MWKPTRVSLGIAGILLAAGLLFAQSATARVGGDSEYSKAQTYSAALRYLRVDLGYEVVERDPDAAYLIFRYQTPGQNKSNATGTVEIVDADGHVKLFVQIPSMPEYHERVLRDGLVRKLHDEYGTPPHKPPPTAPPQKKPEADAGTD
ncbi:MAG TPA: hypothetical protein VER11_06370 [Polyangiaceae bacterium]|jgi:hypothetical protein|nr:hypothetical protein [Polyangiaceae bacterium]